MPFWSRSRRIGCDSRPASAQSVQLHAPRINQDGLLKARVAALETLLEEKQSWLEIMHDSTYRMGVTIAKKDQDNTRLQEENDALRQQLLHTSVAAKTTLFVKDLQDTELEVPLCCPISMDLFKDPVVSKKTGHSYDREHIDKWLLNHSFCPLTKTRMTSADLVPNYALAGVVEVFKAQQLS